MPFADFARNPADQSPLALQAILAFVRITPLNDHRSESFAHAVVKNVSAQQMGPPEPQKTYLVPVQLENEEDERWSAWGEALPGCAVWGHNRAEAIRALEETAQAYIEVLLEKGKDIPKEIETGDAPLAAVSV